MLIDVQLPHWRSLCIPTTLSQSVIANRTGNNSTKLKNLLYHIVQKLRCSLENGIYLFAIYYRLGEGCAHTAAILFKVETAVKNGYTACTSSSCQWNQVYSKKV